MIDAAADGNEKWSPCHSLHAVAASGLLLFFPLHQAYREARTGKQTISAGWSDLWTPFRLKRISTKPSPK